MTAPKARLDCYMNSYNSESGIQPLNFSDMFEVRYLIEIKLFCMRLCYRDLHLFMNVVMCYRKHAHSVLPVY